ncbi:hypothetical protein ACMHYO_09000 [Allopusillimonas ginsengisoli]|uniref:hypothetical protein n=1 Tax=Allopusillimonas ginsengisoli TaxID=453575 RepID=UPI00148545C4
MPELLVGKPSPWAFLCLQQNCNDRWSCFEDAYCDFVPAAKLARTNGVDFVLDAMRNPIDPSLFEHIDGLVNFDIVSILKKVVGQDPDVTPKWWAEGEQQPASSKNVRRRRPGRRLLGG